MKNTISFLAICLCLSFTFCKSQKEKRDDTSDEIIITDITPRIEDPEVEAECQRAVLFEGSRDAYNSLSLTYSGPELLPWALIMANKYGDSGAYNDAFWGFVTMIKHNASDCSLDHLDEETRNMAIGYLKKAHEQGNYGAGDILAKYYFEGKYVKQDSLIGNRIMEQFKKWWGLIRDSTYVLTPFVFE